MTVFAAMDGRMAISPRDLDMLTQTLSVWCRQHKIERKDAGKEARILLDTYHSGKRSQIDLIDALVKSLH